MKYGFISSVLASSLLSFSCFADSAFDYCDKLPGKWHAATHIKDHSTCANYNGCEHFDLMTFKKTDNNEYESALFYSADGSKISVQSFTFSCNGSQLRFLGQEGKTVDLKCDEFNNCYMVVDTPQLTVELVKQ